MLRASSIATEVEIGQCRGALGTASASGAFGVNVDPLGDGLIKLLPEGLAALFLPAAALPALLPIPVVVPVPPVDVPAEPPVAAPAPAPPPAPPAPPPAPPPPPPPAANAQDPDTARAVAKMIAVTFMVSFPFAVNERIKLGARWRSKIRMEGGRRDAK